jgi:hypothetical protein
MAQLSHDPRDRYQHGKLTPVVMKSAHSQPYQAQDVSPGEAAAAATQALELDLPLLDEDERIPPFSLVVDTRGAGRDCNHATLEGWRQLSVEE